MSKTIKPTNQKGVYHSFAIVYEQLMNNEIEIDKAEKACNLLSGMNRTFALEIKKSELEKEIKFRSVESTNFE